MADRAVQWATEGLEQAIRPALGIMKAFRSAAGDLMPDEMELSMRFSVNLKGEVPVLKIVSGEASAQIAITFSWKGEKNQSEQAWQRINYLSPTRYGEMDRFFLLFY